MSFLARFSTRAQKVRLGIAGLVVVSVFLVPITLAQQRVSSTPAMRQGDLNWLIDQVAAHYAYLPTSGVDLEKVRALYLPEASAADTRSAWIHVLEHVIAELHDNHATLGTNTSSSPQLIPTGTDLWAIMDHGHAVITQVRPHSPASAAGLRAGDEIVSVGGIPTLQAVSAALPATLTMSRAGGFTLRRLLAGVHDQKRVLTLKNRHRVVLPPYQPPRSKTLLTWRWLDNEIGYIRLDNSLGDSGTVAAFDHALEALVSAKGMILDLRDTPSGGDTNVAEPIVGRFITTAGAYQRVFRIGPGKTLAKDSTLRMVKPRGPFTFRCPVVVLVNRWTGSMGEGMTIGFKALGRATIVGTQMAGLRGGTEVFTLPNTKISIDFPTYQLYEVSGGARQNFIPDVVVNFQQTVGTNTDDILTSGLEELHKLIEANSK